MRPRDLGQRKLQCDLDPQCAVLKACGHIRQHIAIRLDHDGAQLCALGRCGSLGCLIAAALQADHHATGFERLDEADRVRPASCIERDIDVADDAVEWRLGVVVCFIDAETDEKRTIAFRGRCDDMGACLLRKLNGKYGRPRRRRRGSVPCVQQSYLATDATPARQSAPPSARQLRHVLRPPREFARARQQARGRSRHNSLHAAGIAACRMPHPRPGTPRHPRQLLQQSRPRPSRERQGTDLPRRRGQRKSRNGLIFSETLSLAVSMALIRQFADAAPVSAGARGRFTPAQMKRISDYVYANLGRQDLSLGELASVAGTSPSHFKTLFKRSTGVAAHRFVVQCRGTQAALLLRRGHVTISEVAHDQYPSPSSCDKRVSSSSASSRFAS